jgi:uncharacterized protein YndB with AHSA1/START domain
MAILEATTAIERPAQEVFAFLTDIDAEPKWREGVNSVTIETGRPGAVGLVYTQQISRMGFNIALTVTVTDVELNRRLAYTFAGGPFKGNGSYEIVGDGDTCRVVATMDLGKSVMAKTLGGMMGPQLQKDLDQLKAALEG